ncbi:hypothetical protein [Nocardia terpenica]|uniref:Uncharacterized protein n=1 Tax=Nocardia terpenica TaxID=455432 RepID=A0A6G9ZDM1_9NOCA|nr:hypothetical protein [Nocardia terpenica]QIS23544.1 hypothetical protein F6W96_39945 [Nocardia terpenica]QIS23558.1 hypothetical protein F6W96_40040 [Nocardia terpenica]
MVSWREELTRREAAAAERVQRLREQIAELTDELTAAEQLLSRLTITRETMAEILTEADEPPGSDGPDESTENTNTEQPQPVSGSRSPVGLMLVPQRRPGMDAAAVLPEDYCDILAVLAETGHGLRAGQVAAEVGIATTDRSKVEALRSKLKRLVARGWLDQEPSGVFTITNDAGVVGD